MEYHYICKYWKFLLSLCVCMQFKRVDISKTWINKVTQGLNRAQDLLFSSHPLSSSWWTVCLNTRQYLYPTSALHWGQREAQQRFHKPTVDNWLAQIMKEHRRWQLEEKWFSPPTGITPTALQTLIGNATLGTVRKTVLACYQDS